MRHLLFYATDRARISGIQTENAKGWLSTTGEGESPRLAMSLPLELHNLAKCSRKSEPV